MFFWQETSGKAQNSQEAAVFLSWKLHEIELEREVWDSLLDLCLYQILYLNVLKTSHAQSLD